MEKSKSLNSTNDDDKSQRETSELNELQLSVSKQYQKNIYKYNTLKDKYSDINHQLFHPPTFTLTKISSTQYQNSKIQLIQTIDKLLKDSEIITKLEMKAFKQIHEQQQILQDLQHKITDNYLFLRKTLSVQQNQNFSVEDKLDKLNKMIGTLKGGVQKTLRQTENSNKAWVLKDQEIIQHPLYQKLKEDLQKALMKLQNDRQRFQEQIQKQIQQKQKILSQNSSLRRQAQNTKLKVRSLELEVATHLNKVNELTQKLNQETNIKRLSKSQQKNLKYFGKDFQLDIKTNKQFVIDNQGYLIKRTLSELQLFFSSYSYQNRDQSQMSAPKENQIQGDVNYNSGYDEQKQRSNQNQNLSMDKKLLRTCSVIERGVGEKITKARFTRTSTMATSKMNEEIRQGFVRTKTYNRSVRQESDNSEKTL